MSRIKVKNNKFLVYFGKRYQGTFDTMQEAESFAAMEGTPKEQFIDVSAATFDFEEDKVEDVSNESWENEDAEEEEDDEEEKKGWF